MLGSVNNLDDGIKRPQITLLLSFFVIFTATLSYQGLFALRACKSHSKCDPFNYYEVPCVNVKIIYISFLDQQRISQIRVIY
jgi:hypothetical protein